MLTVNPAKRITAADALKHPWICVSNNISIATVTDAGGEGLESKSCSIAIISGPKMTLARTVKKFCRSHS